MQNGLSTTTAAIVNQTAYSYNEEGATVPALGICLQDDGHNVELVSMATVGERYRSGDTALHDSLYNAGEGRCSCSAVIINGHCIANCSVLLATSSGH